MVDVVVREQTWIDLYAKPHLHDDFLCGLPLQGKQDDHIEVLEHYKSLLPYLVPSESRFLHGHLWHPDLHDENLFVIPSGSVPPEGKIQVNITSCIDWQGAWIGPAFLNLTVPKIFHATLPEALTLPPNFETLDPATRIEANRLHKEALLSKLFETIALPHIAQLPALRDRRNLEELARMTWRTGLLPFKSALLSFESPPANCWYSRDLLIKIRNQWDDVAPGHKCPLDCTPAECEEHAGAFAYWKEHKQRSSALQEEFSVYEFGYLDGDQARFHMVQRQLEARRQEWVASGQTPEGRMVMEILWPYRDTLSDNPRTHLKHER